MPATLTRPSVRLTERFAPSRGLRVDREAGVIRNCHLLGWKSLNNREYLASGVDAQLYENAPVNLGHVKPGQVRSLADRIGRIVNARKGPSGVFGDFEYLRSHPMANVICEAAERMPTAFGFSHTARGREKPGTAGRVIEALQVVESVDLVLDPATTKGLVAESRSAAPASQPVHLWGLADNTHRTARRRNRLQALSERIRRHRPRLGRLFEDLATPAVPASGVHEPGSTDPDPEEVQKSALRKQVLAILDDEGMSLEAALEALLDLLENPEDLLPEPTTPAPAQECRLILRPLYHPDTHQLLLEHQRRQTSRQRPTIPTDPTRLARWLAGH